MWRRFVTFAGRLVSMISLAISFPVVAAPSLTESFYRGLRGGESNN
jgi:hypothetical protein